MTPPPDKAAVTEGLSNERIIAELQAFTLAVTMFGLDGLKHVSFNGRPPSAPSPHEEGEAGR